MTLKIQNYDLGVKILIPEIKHDDRGFISEVFRTDWIEFFDGTFPKQVNLSMSKPGVIRAWHRHSRNQTDYFLVKKGKMKICIYDGNEKSYTFGKLVEVFAGDDELKIVKVPGHFWHGTQTISDYSSETIYFLTNLYNYENPDEERLDWNDPSIIDPRTKTQYNWNSHVRSSQ